MMKKTKIFITDDHALFRQGVRRLLEEVAEFEVVGEAQDAREAISKIRQIYPDILLMDINMPGLSSINAAQLIKKNNPKTKIIFLTMYDYPEYLISCLKAEAAGYILKDTTSTQLITAIRDVIKGKQYISPVLLKKIDVNYIDEKVTNIQTQPEYEDLTGREKEILKMLAEGLSGKEIAVKLKISIKTVDVHKSNLMRKLNIHDRTELIKYAIRNRLICIGF